jgi:hypothetical protein
LRRVLRARWMSRRRDARVRKSVEA